jgi:integrase
MAQMSEVEATCATLARREQCVNGRKGQPLARRRYQKGILELRGSVWTVRFREDFIQTDGSVKRVETRRVVGSREELPTRKLARRRADEIVSHVNRLDYRPTRVATFSEFVEVWKVRALALMKTSTQKAAQTHLRNYLTPQFGKMRMDEFGAAPVQNLISGMAAKGRSHHYVKNLLSTLQSVLRSARAWGYLVGEVRGADLMLPAEGIRHEARFFTAEQAVAIIEAAKNPWRMIFAIAAMMGLRPGEVLGLTVDHLDFEHRLIHVRQTAYYSKLQTPKSRASIAPVPMPAPLEDMLRQYLKTWKPNANRLLFATRKGTAFSENNVVQRKLWPILDGLGIPRCGMHAFRHTHASLLVAQGASPVVAQRQLRHSDVMTTMRHYAHVLGNEQRDAAEKIAIQLRPDATKCDQKNVQVQWLQ